MTKKRATVRALETKDAHRLSADIPLIQDTTEHITPEVAQKMLEKNKANRPVNWRKVQEYRKVMEAGEWKLHAQGIILDDKGNILTGQKRLYAIIYAGIPQYMRVSKGTPADRADLIDRGTAQTNRDLASRKTDRKHSPSEASIARAMYAIDGKIKVSPDDIALMLVENSNLFLDAMEQTRGTRKTKSIMMIIAAICKLSIKKHNYKELFALVSDLSSSLEAEIFPLTIQSCWNKGAAFTLAMEKAMNLCKGVI